MQSTISHTNDTTAVLTVNVSADELVKLKDHVIKELGAQRGDVPGFRKGHAPAALIEKQLDPNAVQVEVLEHAINQYYVEAASAEMLRVVAQPQIEVKKFVPYTELEFAATVEVVGKISLGKYTGVKVDKKKAAVTAKDVDEVITQLQGRSAAKEDVARAAKVGDEVVLDFKGVDAKTREAIAGADAKEYPLSLGSGSFIPGFEEEVIGLKAGDSKSFDIVFPKDYSAKALQGKKVNFEITVHKVQKAVNPKLDDTFAATVGPFKTVEELKSDIKKQLLAEKEQNSERDYENELVQTIADSSKVSIPKVLIDQQLLRLQPEMPLC